MSEPYLGSIHMFGGNFAPRSYALCDGQLIAITQNDALFSLLGTIYGGDGRTTFGLPDLRGRLPMHMGQGPGLSERRIGAKFGGETETLTVNQLPSHTHTVGATTTAADDPSPSGNIFADTGDNLSVYQTPGAAMTLAPNSVTTSGGSQSHENRMPALCINFIIALYGIYPSRN